MNTVSNNVHLQTPSNNNEDINIIDIIESEYSPPIINCNPTKYIEFRSIRQT